MWIYRNYIAPSMFFSLAVNQSTVTCIRKLEDTATKYIKKWLKLPKSATRAILYRPSVLNLPCPPDLKIKAKLSYLSAIIKSKDPLLSDPFSLLNNNKNRTALDFPSSCLSILDEARENISSLPKIKGFFSKRIVSDSKMRWDRHLDSLQVQSKFKDIVALEDATHLWKKISNHGLNAGQLSFTLKAGSDTLPTPVNLHRWKIQVGAKCQLCGSPRPTSSHVLNGCPVALNQGRYTWRHDSVLSHLTK